MGSSVFNRDGDGPGPEEREARIAELRRRRHGRVRWLAVRAVLVAGALVLLLALAGWWLLTTIGGRQFLLEQIVQRLPQGTALTWARAEGPASGPLVLHDVHFEMPRQRDPGCVPTPAASCAMGTIVFDARRVMLDPSIGALLGRELRLDALQVSDAVLRLPRGDTPFQLPRWPESLPEIAPPLALSAGDVRIDELRVLGEAEEGGYRETIAIDELRGGLRASRGELHVERLRGASNRGHFTVDGDYAPGDNYRTRLVATAVWPRTGARLGLAARGDLDAMAVGLAGAAPGAVRAELSLRGGERPQWTLQADADALDLARLLDPAAPESATPLAFQLQAEGVGGRARIEGEFERGGLSATILPSRLHLEEQVLALDPLVLETFDGRIVARGRADFRDPADARFRFAVNADGLRWGGARPDAPAITADASFGLAGRLQAWAAIGEATLVRGDDSARLQFDSRGDAQGLRLRSLQVAMPTGTLDATGRVAWAPTPGWEVEARLAGFDPGYFFPAWDGAVDGELASRGRTRDDGGLEATVTLADLGGQLRGRPLDGEGRFAMHGAADAGDSARYEGELALGLGDSRLQAQGTFGERIELDARFDPLQLADLLPDASGTLQGTVAVSGPRDAPDIRADLVGTGLRYLGYAAQSLSVQGRLPWGSSGDGRLSVRAGGVEAGIALDTLAIDAYGAVESLALDAQAAGPIGTAALSGELDHRANAWQGTLASLQLAPSEGAQWILQQTAEFRWNPATASGELSRSCLASSVGGSLCVSADWPRGGASVQGEGLPLLLARPYLPEAQDDRDWLLRGEIAIDAQLRPLGNGWEGHAEVSSAGGGLRFSERARRELIRYQDLQLQAQFRPQGIEASLSAVLNDDGRLQASVVTGWHATAPLNGELTLDIDELTWLELFSPDIVAPTGRISANMSLGGTRDAPQIGGSAQLVDFRTEIPALAIVLQQGNLQLLAQPDGSARVSGTVDTAPAGGESAPGGVLRIDGSLGWRGREVPLVLGIEGEDVLVSDTPELHAVVSPDITVRVPVEEPVAVTGTVVVEEADIDLEGLDRGVSASPDVVVLDPVEGGDESIATGLVLDLNLVLGEEVTLTGFGLDASLDGRLRVHSRPGTEMMAVGSIEVAGEYSAYGQELTITRGRLSWSNGPIADPVLDIRAEREIGEVTAGVAISGRATAPQVEVWANPAMSQSQALAYLTLGRPLSGLTGTERGQVDTASAALTAGGSYLAGRIGASLGLDEAGVMHSRTAGRVFGIGKQLSPRLYVGYGVSLLGTGTVLTLKYLLDHGFDIEIESSRIENRASINWRKEK